jgi:ectoine hydroxylase-related dioxygenase (phytanoyl-CoA dioxygenase family)
MGFTGANVVTTAWVALSPSNVANGCMYALPLSRQRPSAVELSHPGMNHDEEDVVKVDLKPGEMSLHNPDILHGSKPNVSAEKRVGFVIRFINPDACPMGEKPQVALARGQAPPGRFHLAQPPTASECQTALVAMKTSAVRHLDAVLQNLKSAR